MNSKEIWDAKVCPLFLTLHKKFTIYEQQLSQYFHTKISNCIQKIHVFTFCMYFAALSILLLRKNLDHRQQYCN